MLINESVAYKSYEIIGGEKFMADYNFLKKVADEIHSLIEENQKLASNHAVHGGGQGNYLPRCPIVSRKI